MQDLLRPESPSLFRHFATLSERDGELTPVDIRPCLVAADPLQTKDFVKFVPLVAILYVGTSPNESLLVAMLRY